MLSLLRTALITSTIIATATINFAVPFFWLAFPSMEHYAFFNDWFLYKTAYTQLAQWLPIALSKPVAAGLILALGVLSAILVWSARITQRKVIKIAGAAGFGHAHITTLTIGDKPKAIPPLAIGFQQWLEANPEVLPVGTKLHIFDTPAFNAAAFTDLLKSRHIVVSTGVIQSISRPEHLGFILLHELGHIECNHSYSALFMVGASTASQWANKASHFTGRMAHKAIRAIALFPLPFLKLLDFTAFIFVTLFNGFAAINALLFSSLLVIDKFIARAMEYEADSFAAKQHEIIAQGGIDVLTALKKSFDWFPSLSGTHPSNSARIRNIKRQKPN